ncbi:hypothetical protein HK105_205527 [Polyrhizophydium stewartii]|uniref:G-protein coupled receptors family 1 profile domain-containing protein n=1 Tax=Polyrhizophydium stewartii TaxID=2732419 RepID=A0ABR4N677_9FUNG
MQLVHPGAATLSPMPLSPSQLALTSTLVTVSSALSLLGVGIVFTFYVRRPVWFRNLMGRLVLSLTASDLISTVTKGVGRLGPDAGIDSLLCQTQAVFVQIGNLSAVFISFAIAANMVFIVFLGGDAYFLKRSQWLVIFMSFVVSIFFGLALLVIKPGGNRNIVGDANLWCWIDGKYVIFQVWLFFLELWVIFIFQIVAYLLTWVSIKQLQALASRQRVTPAVIAMRKYNLIMTRRMQSYTLVFLFVWLPSTFNRIAPLISGEIVYGLTIAQATISPLRGMINCLVFLYIQYLLESDSDREISQTISEIESASVEPSGPGVLAVGLASPNNSLRSSVVHGQSIELAPIESKHSTRSNATSGSKIAPQPAAPASKGKKVRFIEPSKSLVDSVATIGIDTIAEMVDPDYAPPAPPPASSYGSIFGWRRQHNIRGSALGAPGPSRGSASSAPPSPGVLSSGSRSSGTPSPPLDDPARFTFSKPEGADDGNDAAVPKW